MKSIIAVSGIFFAFLCLIGSANTHTLLERELQRIKQTGYQQGAFSIMKDMKIQELSNQEI